MGFFNILLYAGDFESKSVVFFVVYISFLRNLY